MYLMVTFHILFYVSTNCKINYAYELLIRCYCRLWSIIFCLIKYYQSPIYINVFFAASLDLCRTIHVYNIIRNSIIIIMNYL